MHESYQATPAEATYLPGLLKNLSDAIRQEENHIVGFTADCAVWIAETPALGLIEVQYNQTEEAWRIRFDACHSYIHEPVLWFYPDIEPVGEKMFNEMCRRIAEHMRDKRDEALIARHAG